MKKLHKPISVFVLLALLLVTTNALAAPGDTMRVSVRTDGTQGNGNSYYPSVSSDGRYVAFSSAASNLVTGDINGAWDIFVRDRATDTTTRVSVRTDGTQGNSDSIEASISPDGCYVAFQSYATNLTVGDTNGAWDIFVHDCTTGDITRASESSGGTQGNGNSMYPSISSDGRYVAFQSDANNLVSRDFNWGTDAFVHDRATDTTTRISVGAGGTEANGYNPSISADGRYVAFQSNSANLVTGDTNARWDIFVHDRTTGGTTRVSVDTGGAQGTGDSYNPSISSDGSYVAFESDANNLVAGDTNGWRDIFMHDRTSGTTTRVSVGAGGAQGTGASNYPSISSDGRYVAFDSDASNLVAADTNGARDVFVHNRTTGVTTRVSVDTGGAQGNGNSNYPSTSSDGTYVAFDSNASNLVAGDTNGARDVFVHEQDVIAPSLLSFTRQSPASSPTNADTLVFRATFSENVQNVNATDFVVNGTIATITNVTAVTGSSIYDITVSGGDLPGLSGVVGLDLSVGQDITDLADNPLPVGEPVIDETYEVNNDFPLVSATNLAVSYTGRGPSSFIVTFNKNVNNAGGGTAVDDAAYPANYRLINKGGNKKINTGNCASPLAGDDKQVTINSVVYIPNTAVVTLVSSLPAGYYRLFVCGTTSIVDLAGNHLNNGADYTFDFVVNAADVPVGDGDGDAWALLPITGFAPGRVTRLTSQPTELTYTKMSDLWLEIPSQKIKANIVGVPQSENVWDVKWLGNDVGWLNGTAFPTWEGNSVITAHVMGADGLPGPFAKLQDLQYGERIIVHLSRQQYIFEVRNKRLVRPDSTAFAFEHLENASYLTLVTCSGYNEESNTYSFRRLVRAVLVEVE
jgi:LPXTG-site transpeptidase (sortase) family protein